MIITPCNQKVIFITHAVLKNVLSVSSDCSSDCVPLMQRAVYGIFASWLKSACFYIVVFVRSHIFDCINVKKKRLQIWEGLQNRWLISPNLSIISVFSHTSGKCTQTSCKNILQVTIKLSQQGLIACKSQNELQVPDLQQQVSLSEYIITVK